MPDPLLTRADFARSNLRARYEAADHLGDPDAVFDDVQRRYPNIMKRLAG